MTRVTLCVFLLVACCLWGCASGKPQYRQPVGVSTLPIGNLAAGPYDFNYKVEYPPTNTFFGQNENGDAAGNKVGSYYVLLPDGRTLTVNYVADAYGYQPKISFQGGRP